MHRWETASEQDIQYIISRPNLAQMGKLKFYVLRGQDTLYGHLNVAAEPLRRSRHIAVTVGSVRAPIVAAARSTHAELHSRGATTPSLQWMAWKPNSSAGSASTCPRIRALRSASAMMRPSFR